MSIEFIIGSSRKGEDTQPSNNNSTKFWYSGRSKVEGVSFNNNKKKIFQRKTIKFNLEITYVQTIIKKSYILIGKNFFFGYLDVIGNFQNN